MNNHYIEHSRSGCALLGALATIAAINRVVPVVHSTAGCSIQYQEGIVPFGGSTPSGAQWGAPLSSSNISQKHVVFGGGSRLREQLKNTVKVVSADLFVVLTGCATEMVGDDIRAMTKEGREQGFPVICANTPGFGGSFHRGYQQAIRALIEQLPELQVEATPRNSLVNIWGVVPQQDAFWYGHLQQIEALLDESGIVANTLFGGERGLKEWKDIPYAALNVVVSQWGRETAILLEQKYGTPWIEVAGLPIGPLATDRLIQAIANYLPLDADALQSIQQRKQQQFSRTLATLGPVYYRIGLQREFAIVGELSLVSGVVYFLAHSLGLIPKLAIITDVRADEHSEAVTTSLIGVAGSSDISVEYSEDAGEIRDLLRSSDAELLIGSSLEREIAEELNVPLLAIFFPVADSLILNRGYLGDSGALALIEDIGGAILRSSRSAVSVDRVAQCAG